jgi:drug/metabolite transporter (DMT)-like permease
MRFDLVAGESSGRTATTGRPNTSVLLAFTLAVILGGASAVATRFTVAELAPFWSATMRFAAAAIIFFIIALIRRAPWPRGRTLQGVLLYGILNFGLSYALVYYAIREVTAGFTMVIMGLTPLLTFLFAVLHRLEPFHWRVLLGTLLALAGIALAFAGQADSGAPLWAVLFIIVGSACFAEATVVLKMLPPVSPLTANALGMAAGTVLLAALSLIAGEAWLLPQESQTWAAVLYLIVGSVAVFYLSVYVLQHWTATASSYMVVVAPFVTVPLGALLAGEEITAGLLLGALLVLAAVIVGVLLGGTINQEKVEAPAAEA